MWLLILIVNTVFELSSQEISAFNADLINSENNEYGLTISKDGTEVYFTRAEGIWGKTQQKSSIYRMRFENNTWAAAVKMNFTGDTNESDPHLTSDNKRLYFISEYPVNQDSSANIWYVTRDQANKEWGKPIALDSIINSPNTEYSPKSTAAGDMYFASDRPTGFGQGDLYFAKSTATGFSTPENLGKIINTAKGEWNLEIDPTGTVLIFEASQREQNKSSYGDLYISFKRKGFWSIPINIIEINTNGSELYPVLSDSILWYASSRTLNGAHSDILAIPFNKLKEKYSSLAIFPD